MKYDRIKSCYHFVEGECPHQRTLNIVCLFPQLLGREKYAKYHKAVLDCLCCGQFINRWPSQNLENRWSDNKGESCEVLVVAD